MGIFTLHIPAWPYVAETGYKPLTTVWEDMAIAERFGADAMADTVRRLLEYAGDRADILAEIAMVLNHRIWYWHEANEPLARAYDTLWRFVDDYALGDGTPLDEAGRLQYLEITD